MPLTVPLPSPFALNDGELANNSSGALTANGVYLVAVVLWVPAVLTSVRMRFNAGGNGHFDTGVYDATGANGAPNNLLAHAASSNTALATATGLQSPALIGGNLALSPGRYWLALWVDNATDTVTKQTTGNANIPIVQSGTNAGPLPALASSITALANVATKPLLIGLLSGGWS